VSRNQLLTASKVKYCLSEVHSISFQAIFINGGNLNGCVCVDSLLATSHDDVCTPLPTFNDLDSRRSGDVAALILFSSGTTGNQKAVVLSHKNLQASLTSGR
jgi:acyl-CoA synthetase (AMP-forming)/AMP-acid ligase II